MDKSTKTNKKNNAVYPIIDLSGLSRTIDKQTLSCWIHYCEYKKIEYTLIK